MRLNSNVISLFALVISTLSAIFSYVQYRTATAQLHLNEQQTRPYVKYQPYFTASNGVLQIDMALENFSSIPANIQFSQLTAWVDGKHLGWDFHSTSPDIVYQHKGGGSSLPPITGPLVDKLKRGESLLSIGVCVLYTSTTKAEPRTWLLRAVYEYSPRSELATTRYIEEEEVSKPIQKCVAKDTEEFVLQSIPLTDGTSVLRTDQKKNSKVSR